MDSSLTININIVASYSITSQTFESNSHALDFQLPILLNIWKDVDPRDLQVIASVLMIDGVHEKRVVSDSKLSMYGDYFNTNNYLNKDLRDNFFIS